MCRCFSLKAPIRVMVIVNILWPLAEFILVAMTILGAAFGDKVVAGVNTSHLEILHWKVTSLFVVGMFIFVTVLWLIINRIWWPCLVPTSITRFASDLGTEWSKINRALQGKCFFYEQWHQIPYHRRKNTTFPHKSWIPLWIACLSYF